MSFGEFFLNSKKDIKFNINDIKDQIKREDYEKNEKLRAIFDLFDIDSKKDGKISTCNKQGKNEIESIFKQLSSADNNNDSVIDETEANNFIKTHLPNTNITSSDLFTFLSSLIKFNNTQTQPQTSTQTKQPSRPKSDKEVQTGIIESLRSDSDETLSILAKQNIGSVTEVYDNIKKLFNSDISSAKVMEAAVNQAQGAKYMEKAQTKSLTMGEYIKENQERLKEMIKNRLYQKDSNGIDYIDKHRKELKLSRAEFEKLMLNTIEHMTHDMDINNIKKLMRKFPTTTEVEDKNFLDSIKQSAITLYGQNRSTIDTGMKQIKDTTRTNNFSPDDNRLLSFEEVFYYENGIDYSKDDCEEFLNNKDELTEKLSAYNKFLQFDTEKENILQEKDAEKALNKLIELYENYYANPFDPDLAFTRLQNAIQEAGLPINVMKDETGKILISMMSGADDLLLSYVFDILSVESKNIQQRLTDEFGGEPEETLAELQKNVEHLHEKAFGNDFSAALAKMMAEDNKTFIRYYSGAAATTGMGLMFVGGILCCTPAAAVGSGMTVLGQGLAMSGIAAESALGYTEAMTRKYGAEEGEYEELTKNTIVNIGGFAAGAIAGKAGNLAFSKFINKKLADTLKMEITQGNRLSALKQVFSSKELLLNFMKAGGAKISSDFLLSLAGDLIMMGVLNTNDDCISLLKANLMGIMVGTAGEAKHIAQLGKKGDVYRSLLKKEAEGKLSAQEANTLLKLKQDSDIQKAYDTETGSPKPAPDLKEAISDHSVENSHDLYKQVKKMKGEKLSEGEFSELIRGLDDSPENMAEISKLIATIEENNGSSKMLREIINHLKEEQKTPAEINSLIKNIIDATKDKKFLFCDDEYSSLNRILMRIKREDNVENFNKLIQEYVKAYGKTNRIVDVASIKNEYAEKTIELMQKYSSDPELRDAVDPSKANLVHSLLCNAENTEEMAARIKDAQKLINLKDKNYGRYALAKRKILTAEDKDTFNKYMERLEIIKSKTGHTDIFDSKDIAQMYECLLNIDDVQFNNLSKYNLWEKAFDYNIGYLLELTDVEFSRFASRNIEVDCANINLVKLNDTEYKRYTDRNLNKYNGEFYAKLNDEEWNVVQKYSLISSRDENTVRHLLNKGENYIQKLQERGLLDHVKRSYNAIDLIDKFANMSEEEFKVVRDRKLTEDFPNRMMKHNDIIKPMKFSLSDIYDLTQISEKDWPRIQYLLTVFRWEYDMNLSHYWFDTKIESHVEPFDIKQAVELSKLSDDDFNFLKNSGALNELSMDSIRTLLDFQKFVGIENIKDLTTADYRRLASVLTKHNDKLFAEDFINFINKKYGKSILPKNKDEYCSLLSKASKEGVRKFNPAKKEQQARFENALTEMGRKDSAFLKADLEAKDFKLDMEYPREKFMQDVMSELDGLSTLEKQRIMDYYGFEVYVKDGKLVMSGYPTVLKNVPELTSPQGKKVQKLVEKYTNNNKVSVKDNPELSKMLNDIFDAFPELKGIIGKVQHGVHSYTVDVHTLKVLQGVMSNPKFESLSPKDKKILTISTLMHDISKKEDEVDKLHPQNSALEANQLLSKMDLTKEEKENIYKIVKNHDWLERYNSMYPTREARTCAIQQMAYALKDGNNFELASILAEADLKGVQRGGTFYDEYSNVMKQGVDEISKIIKDIHKTDIYIPQTRIPKASQLKVDGNIVEEKVIKGYKVKILHLRKGQDLSAVGFPKGTMSDDVQMLYHGCGHKGHDAEALKNIETLKSFDDITSDAVTSNSILNTSKPEVYAPYGYIHYADNSKIIAASFQNLGSGYASEKNIPNMVERYVFGPLSNSDSRQWFPDKMKEKLNLNDDEYISLYKEIEGMSLTELRQKKPKIATAIDEILYETDRARREKAESTGANGQRVTEVLVKAERQAIGCPYGSREVEFMPEALLKDAVESDFVIICID